MQPLPSTTFAEYPSPISTNRQAGTSPLSPLAPETWHIDTVKELSAKTDGGICSNGRHSNDLIILDVKGTEFRVLGVSAPLKDDVVETVDGGRSAVT